MKETGKNLCMEKNEEYKISHKKHKSEWFHSGFFRALKENKQFQCYLHAPRKLRERCASSIY